MSGEKGNLNVKGSLKEEREKASEEVARRVKERNAIEFEWWLRERMEKGEGYCGLRRR